jgi:hypothetical protein
MPQRLRWLRSARDPLLHRLSLGLQFPARFGVLGGQIGSEFPLLRDVGELVTKQGCRGQVAHVARLRGQEHRAGLRERAGVQLTGPRRHRRPAIHHDVGHVDDVYLPHLVGEGGRHPLRAGHRLGRRAGDRRARASDRPGARSVPVHQRLPRQATRAGGTLKTSTGRR